MVQHSTSVQTGVEMSGPKIEPGELYVYTNKMMDLHENLSINGFVIILEQPIGMIARCLTRTGKIYPLAVWRLSKP